MATTDMLKIGLVDDHKLFRRGLVSLIRHGSPDCQILFEADDGNDMQQKINPKDLPDVILMDVNMPRMDGFAAVTWLRQQYPDIKVLVVSMVNAEETIVRMLRLGVKGYLCKDVESAELSEALREVANKGYYYTDFVTRKLVHSLSRGDHDAMLNHISDQERKFIELACSEMTYVEIADIMCLSPKTIDGYRNSLFEKLKVKSRVGLVIFAIKHGLVALGE
ncbi:MAG: response regulator transcription factor [Cyclobacteriaceae bacterium]